MTLPRSPILYKKKPDLSVRVVSAKRRSQSFSRRLFSRSVSCPYPFLCRQTSPPPSFSGLFPPISGSAIPQQAAVLALRRSGVFDEAAYLELNPDVRESGMDPILHYLQFGGREGRKAAWISPELLKREEYSRANACFAQKDYRRALSLYERLADELGQDVVAARIALCKEGIERSQLSLSVIIPAHDAEATIGRAGQRACPDDQGRRDHCF